MGNGWAEPEQVRWAGRYATGMAGWTYAPEFAIASRTWNTGPRPGQYAAKGRRKYGCQFTEGFFASSRREPRCERSE